jgi:hypothetical protein
VTATKPPAGFWDTLVAHTTAVFWQHYDKALTVLIAGFMGWASVYGTAWIGLLPQPPAPKAIASVPVPPTAPPPPADTRLDAVEKLIKDQSTAIDDLLKELRSRARPRPAAPAK